MSRICILILLITLCVAFNTNAADSYSVNIQSSPSDVHEFGSIVAEVNPAVAAFKIQISASGIAEELVKCESLIDLAGQDIVKIFDGAVSGFKVSVTLTEDRSRDNSDLAWKNALGAIASAGKFKFDSSIGTSIPSPSSLALSILSASYSKTISKKAEQYLLKAFEGEVNAQFSKQLVEYQTTGILRANTDSQAAVCFAALVKTGTAKLAVNGRTFDRITERPILDKQCVKDRLLTMNSYFGDFRGTLQRDELAMIFGFLLSDLAPKPSVWSKKSSSCSIDGSSFLQSEQARSRWLLILRTWTTAADAQKNYAVIGDDLEKAAALHASTETKKTEITYNISGINISRGGNE